MKSFFACSVLILTIGTPAAARSPLPDSVRLAPERVVRANLASGESAAPLNLVVSLRLRHYDRLQAVLQAGGTVTADEMERQFLPFPSDYERLAAWLKSQGLTQTLDDSRHTHLFFRGAVSDVARALQMNFGRVATPNGEFTSALSAPSLPDDLAAPVLGIAGLQPELEVPVVAPRLPVGDATLPTRAIPADLLAAYHVPAGLTGAGQTIAVFGSNVPQSSDLSLFYQTVGSSSTQANYTLVLVNGGPSVTGPAGIGFSEVSMDSEWSTGLAPGAKLVMYACPTGGLTDFMTTCALILNSGGVNVLTSSFSNAETALASASLDSCSQLLAQMAAAGISVFHGAGDSGAYGSPEYPTTDPYVTALSGTMLTFDVNWNEVSEVVWPNTGGGYSTHFARPAWQQGNGVPASTFRCVPDAGAPSSMVAPGGQSFSLVITQGSASGIGGSSLTGPVWAGLTALINQSRAIAGLGPVGLYGPRIYPLLGTSAFTDITSGNDGAFSAGPGYDLCSGVGTPVVNALITALQNEPAVTTQPQSQSVIPGATVVLNAGGTGSPLPTYQWYCNGAALPGATGPRLVLANAGAANAGSYTCLLSNSLATISSQPAVLTVAASANPGRLVNLSVLSQGGAASPLTLGFVTGGAAAGTSQSLLLRASGPALTAFGVTGILPDPLLTLYQSGQALGGNDNWGVNAAAVTAAGSLTGAFALTAGSLDAAMVTALPGGNYTMVVGGAGAGMTLAEVYDATAGAFSAANPRLINLSCLGQVQGAAPLTAGFVVGGATSRTVLIRATGPALAAFGVAHTLADPEIALHGTVAGSDAILASNAGWGGDPQIAAAAAAVYAFALNNPASADSALLVTLPPGNYTAQVTSASGAAAGTSLIEVYDVP